MSATTRKPRLPPERVEAELRRLFGAISNFERIAEGEESQAFAFASGREQMIARINRDAEGFRKDALAQQLFSAPNLPIPKVRCIADLEGSALCVSVRAVGLTLQALGDEAATCAPALAITLDAMAAADISAISGFGPFSSDRTGSFGSWGEFVAAIGDPQRYDWSNTGKLLDKQALHRLLGLVEDCAGSCTDIRALVHGDFGSNNVLAAGNAITAVIDWSEALTGDPLYDVANIFFWRPWLACMEQQCRYFEQHQSQRIANDRRLRCYQIRIGLETLHEALRDEDTSVATWALERCTKIARGL